MLLFWFTTKTWLTLTIFPVIPPRNIWWIDLLQAVTLTPIRVSLTVFNSRSTVPFLCHSWYSPTSLPLWISYQSICEVAFLPSQHVADTFPLSFLNFVFRGSLINYCILTGAGLTLKEALLSLRRILGSYWWMLVWVCYFYLLISRFLRLKAI